MDEATEDTLRILVATDNHLGYGELDRIKSQDSFVSFEEILQLAVQNNVDFVLLGGDLFHDSKPSPFCINKCLELLRKYCLGDKPVSIEFLSDQSQTFQNMHNPIVNYEDPNLNIALPIFTIHGNHDDPTGHAQISALDIISNSGLINYFGRMNDLRKVEIRPILLQKGITKLALYGLSHIRDERLGRLFRNKNVVMKKPPESEDGDEWFHLLVLHQNRAPRGQKNFIPATVLDDFLDLVIWGHEHDCHMEPVAVNGIYISQPGSSVATSLAQGEAIPKQVGLLLIHQRKFQMIPIPLTTVRPFIFRELILENPESAEYAMDDPKAQAITQVTKEIKEMIAEGLAKNTDRSQSSRIPLIKLIVFYYNEQQVFNVIKFGQQFVGVVANPEDLVSLKCFVAKHRGPRKYLNETEGDGQKYANVNRWANRVEDVVETYFEGEREAEMKIISLKSMNKAMSRFVHQGDSDAIGNLIQHQMSKTMQKLMELDPDEESFEECVENFRRRRKENEGGNGAANAAGDAVRIDRNLDDEDQPIVLLDSDEDEAASLPPRAVGKGTKPKDKGGKPLRTKASTSAGGRTPPTPRTGAKAKGKAQSKKAGYMTLDQFLD